MPSMTWATPDRDQPKHFSTAVAGPVVVLLGGKPRREENTRKGGQEEEFSTAEDVPFCYQTLKTVSNAWGLADQKNRGLGFLPLLNGCLVALPVALGSSGLCSWYLGTFHGLPFNDLTCPRTGTFFGK